jgi:aminoglycoside phosphotransferase (APT) family kinase protein
MLSSAQVAACHRQIAAALLALQSVTLPGFDEALSAAPSESSDLRSVLRRRAQLRIADPARRDVFLELLDREGGLFALSQRPVLVHDDLHHANVVFQSAGGQWLLKGFLDWDKAWAGPAESDVARMALWDDMTGPAFWRVYRSEHPELPGEAERRLVHQLLWCLEYDVDTPRHRADTTAICDQLGIAPPRGMSRPAWSQAAHHVAGDHRGS